MTSPWAISPHFYHTIFSKYTLNTYIPLSSGHLSLSSSLLHPPWLCLSLKPLLSAARTRSRSSALRVCVFLFHFNFFPLATRSHLLVTSDRRRTPPEGLNCSSTLPISLTPIPWLLYVAPSLSSIRLHPVCYPISLTVIGTSVIGQLNRLH